MVRCAVVYLTVFIVQKDVVAEKDSTEYDGSMLKNTLCKFFGTPEGCRFGDECFFLRHSLQLLPGVEQEHKSHTTREASSKCSGRR